ncbi:MAG: Lrp/AsnC ligand binding domain-containing protein [bacterium]
MTKAYILIEALPGKAVELAGKIKGLEGVETLHLVTGPYDAIVFTKVADLKTLSDTIVRKIQATGMVARTLTCIAVEE